MADDENKRLPALRRTRKVLRSLTRAGALSLGGLLALMYGEQHNGWIQQEIGKEMEEIHSDNYQLNDDSSFVQKRLAELGMEPIDKLVQQAFNRRSNSPWIKFFDIDNKMIFHEKNVALTTTYGQTSRYALDGGMSAEDQNFPEHHGVDVFATLSALVSNVSGQMFTSRTKFSGASTISMQVVDMLLEDHPDKYKNKIIEYAHACELERKFSKQEILALYLNLANFGQDVQGPIIGIESAAWRYFGKSAAELDLIESASLIAMVNKPSIYGTKAFDEVVVDGNKEGRNYTQLLGRINYVLKRMSAEGYIEHSEFNAARKQLHYEGVVFDTDNFQKKYADADTYEVATAVHKRVDRLLQGRDLDNVSQIIVHTTVDKGYQKVARQALTEKIEELRPGYEHPELLNGSMVVLDLKTNSVLAMIGGLGVEKGDFLNRADIANTTIGSTAKSFIVCIAEKILGYTPETRILDTRREYVTDSGIYSPDNFGGEFSNREVTIADTIRKSINSPAIEIGYQLMQHDKARLIGEMNKFGFGLKDFYLSTSIGAFEASTLTLAGAYAVFANGGFSNKNQFGDMNADLVKDVVLKYKDGKEEKIVPGSVKTRLIEDPQILADMDEMLKDVVRRGTGTRARLDGYSPGGKSGTGQSSFTFVEYEQALGILVLTSIASDNVQKTGPFGPELTGGRHAAPQCKKVLEYSKERSYLISASNM